MSGQVNPLAAECDVAVVGGGTAGLALAAWLARAGAGRVTVLERGAEAGGVPLHCRHSPFGLREYGWPMTGPGYARRNRDEALRAGASIMTGVTVTAIRPGGELELFTAEGAGRLAARRIVLATGLREASRAQRMIGGERPGRGVVTTGALQGMLLRPTLRPFLAPVILGSELVSASAVLSCRLAGIRPKAMLEEAEELLMRPVFRPVLPLGGVAGFTGLRDLRIIGCARVEAVGFTLPSGEAREIETDGVIVSGRFRPEASLLRQSGIEIDPGTGGPVVDQFGRCSDPACFAAGNVLRPAESSGWCWREARAVAVAVLEDLRRPGPARMPDQVPVRPAPGEMHFALPQRISAGGGAGGLTRMQFGLSRPAEGRLVVRTGGIQVYARSFAGKPVRRILAPLDPLRGARDAVEISIE